MGLHLGTVVGQEWVHHREAITVVVALAVLQWVHLLVAHRKIWTLKLLHMRFFTAIVP